MSINSMKKSVIEHDKFISSLVFSQKEPNLLLSSSWDGTLSILDSSTQEKSIFNLPVKDPECNYPLPIIQADFLQNSSEDIISLDLTNKIRISNMNTTKFTEMSLPIESQLFSFCQVENTESDLVLLDNAGNIYRIDTRTPNLISAKVSTQEQITSVKLVNNLLIGVDLEQIHLFDIKELTKPIKEMPHTNVGDEITSMDYVSNESIILGGSEGRIAVEFLDNTKGKNYSFKCHRVEEETRTNVYAVTSIKYDPKKRIFYSGGEDGMIYSWDYLKKKRISKGIKEPSEISNIAINQNLLAYSVSTLIDGNESEDNKNPHYVNIVDMNDVKFFTQSKK